MADVDELNEDLQRIQTEYLNFLDDKNDQGEYTDAVKDMIATKGSRLIVNINDLRKSKYSQRTPGILNNTFEELQAFQRALKEFAAECDPAFAKQHEQFFVGFEGSFGSRHVSPRTLTAHLLGKMVCVEGIVTKCSLIRPKVVRSVHYCPNTQKTIERRYTDLTSYDAFPSGSVYPTKDDDGNLLETEYGLSTYKDHQTLTIQEMPEKSPPGQLPRSVDIVADNDLVDLCKPGDRVQVIGTYRCLPGKQGAYTTGTFRTVLIANNILLLNKEISQHITRDDVIKCRKLSNQRSDVFEMLSKSLAPSIHGHDYIKKALLCMLVGGVEKILPNGTRLRGDINVLLIGDPSVAKSQLLRYVLHTAPQAISTTGRGSSGVGLTAAVTTDHETGERRLEAGAMVLADRGVVCIDEFDKMSDMDRTAIHEVMEQGRVTIAKAGIHAQLNARCSVLAAANPVYGRYDQYKTPMENIGLQDSLLSRFDLLFIVLDVADPDVDKRISDHVVRMHRYRTPGEQDGDTLPMGSAVDLLTTREMEEGEKDESETPIFEKYDALLHGTSRSKKDKIVTSRFMKKYIQLCRNIKPVLSREAADCIAEEYTNLRSYEMENTDIARTQPVTPRALETLIRLATAHAKIRMHKTVELEDAQAAIELVQFAYFKKVMGKEKKRRHRDSDSEAEEVQTPRKQKRPRQARKQPGEEGYDPYDFDSDGEADHAASQRSTRSRSSQKGKKSTAGTPAEDSEEPATEPMEVELDSTMGTITEERLQLVKKSVFDILKEERTQTTSVDAIVKYLAKKHRHAPFDMPEINAALARMDQDNNIMLSEGVVYLI